MSWVTMKRRISCAAHVIFSPILGSNRFFLLFYKNFLKFNSKKAEKFWNWILKNLPVIATSCPQAKYLRLVVCNWFMKPAASVISKRALFSSLSEVFEFITYLVKIIFYKWKYIACKVWDTQPWNIFNWRKSSCSFGLRRFSFTKSSIFSCMIVSESWK